MWLFPSFSVCRLLAEEAAKTKVEVSLHSDFTDHNASENWEEKLAGEVLPLAVACVGSVVVIDFFSLLILLWPCTKGHGNSADQRTALGLGGSTMKPGNGKQSSVRLRKAEQNREPINSLNTAIILALIAHSELQHLCNRGLMLTASPGISRYRIFRSMLTVSTEHATATTSCDTCRHLWILELSSLIRD